MDKKRKGTYSLKKQLIWLVMIGYFSLLVLLVVFDCYSLLVYWNQRKQSTLEGFNKCITAIDESMAAAEDLIRESCIENQNFETLAANQDEFSIYSSAYFFSKQMNSKMLSRTKLKGIVLFYEYGDSCRYSFHNMLDFDKKIYLKETVLEKMQEPGYDNGWFLIQLEEDFFAARLYEKKGAAVVGIISLNKFDFDIQEYTLTETEISIIDTHQTIKEKSDNSLVYQETIAGLDVIFQMKVKNDFWSQLPVMQVLPLLVTAFSVAFVIFLQFFLRKQLLKPLYDLTDTMNQIGNGQWDIKVRGETKILEFQEVQDTLYTMVEEIKRLKVESYEEKLDKQKAQMQYLQLQLKPHFFLNCLKSLNALTIEKSYEKMQNLIFSISAHLRYLLQSDNQVIKVREEVVYVQNYMDLQNTISYRKVSCEMQIAPEVMECTIPALAIQTFVENSFKYAKLNEGETKLRLTIKAIFLHTEQEGFIDLTVSDNGEGYSDEILEILNSRQLRDIRGMGIGIINLKKRCFLLYGDSAECFFHNQKGAVSELIIPCNKEQGL